MEQKKKPCDTCGVDSYIFSKGRCKSCSMKTYKKAKPITEKSLAKRREERKGLPEFFTYAIEDMKSNPFCQNCGARINTSRHPVNNIAHILSKSVYKSVSCHKENYLFLCSDKDEASSCHEKFDSCMSVRQEMRVFELARTKFLSFSDDCVERGHERNVFEISPEV